MSALLALEGNSTQATGPVGTGDRDVAGAKTESLGEHGTPKSETVHRPSCGEGRLDDDPGDTSTASDAYSHSDEDGAEDSDGGWRRSKGHYADSTPPLPPLPVVAGVRYTDYEGFKNYYDEKQASFAIQVLEAGYDIRGEVDQELERRGQRRSSSTTPPRFNWIGTTTDEIWIQRVRIQSKHILAHFRTVVGASSISWDKPRTFFRPFHAFIHFQPKMKEALEKTRERLSLKQSKRGDTESGIPGGRGNESASDYSWELGLDSLDSSYAVPEDVLICQEAVDHLQCYVDFVDDKIMPLWNMYKGTSRKHIRYSDLAYLFHPGDVVYSPAPSESTNTSYSASRASSSVYQPVWKIQYTNPPSINDRQPEEYNHHHRFYISCFYIDFDGEAYGPVKYRFDIAPYPGEININILPVYPIRYHTCSGRGTGFQDIERLHTAGKDFQRFVREKHLYYRGWTLTTNPNGETLANSTGEPMNHPDHVDSSVIVDFKAALEALPSWRPTFKEPSPLDGEWTEKAESVPEIQWSDSKRTKEIRRTHAYLQQRDAAHSIETAEYSNNDPFLVAYTQDLTDEKYELADDNLQLLPGRVMGYVLRDRTFVQLDVRLLCKIEQQEDVFGSLKIAEDHKEMVMALVDSHFRKKATKDPRHFSLGQDLIRGKGEGLVVLLHGVPGVGKTATAEAVAQAKNLPLFVITCGDLGFTPKEVGKSLEEIFRLAYMWDCILLLDEADIFLTERTRNDLKRNALVSVFLRVLEYYNGILFLTTNRVGTLDEAFKSRIHMSLYYPPLDREQTLQIFDMNIARIEQIEQSRHRTRGVDADKEDEGVVELPQHLVVDRERVLAFAQKHFDTSTPQARWNGRQIRNAFQIASSLALYDGRRAWKGEGELRGATALHSTAVLSDEQFWKAARTTRRFEEYMVDTRGVDDTGLARLDRLRADDHGTENDHDHDHATYVPMSDRGPQGSYRGSGQWVGGPPRPVPLRAPQGPSWGSDEDFHYRHPSPDDGFHGGRRGRGRDGNQERHYGQGGHRGRGF